MNYEALQMLIKSLIANFKCNFCLSSIATRDINLLSVEGKKVDIEIICPSCKKSSFIKSEVVSIDLSKINLTNNQLTMIKNTIDLKNRKKVQNSELINDSFIVELDKNLKKDRLNVNDLFE